MKNGKWTERGITKIKHQMYLVMRVAPFGYNLGCRAEREGDKVVEMGAVLQRPGMSGDRGGRFVISKWETLKVFKWYF